MALLDDLSASSLAARARATNGAERSGASPASARPVPVFVKKRRLENTTPVVSG